jgi:hypothetical protein
MIIAGAPATNDGQIHGREVAWEVMLRSARQREFDPESMPPP